MKIAILGTGRVGRTLAARLVEVGHEVTIGTRDPEGTLARTEPDAMGNPPFAQWAGEHADIRLATYATAASAAELIVHAGNGGAALEILQSAGADNLAGKVLVDVSNPLDFSKGFPPTLLVKDTDSLGEQIQRAFPEARVVKSLNTLGAPLMAYPQTLPEDTTVFVSGNDAAAKQHVTQLLASFGHRDVLDLGDITTARGVEMLMPLWLRLLPALGTATFNYRIVR